MSQENNTQDKGASFEKILKHLSSLVEAIAKIKTPIQVTGLALCPLLILTAYYYTTGAKVNYEAILHLSSIGLIIFFYGLSLHALPQLLQPSRTIFAFTVLFSFIGLILLQSKITYDYWYKPQRTYVIPGEQLETKISELKEKISLNEKEKQTAKEAQNHDREKKLSNRIKKDKQLLRNIIEKREFILKDPKMMTDILQDLQHRLEKASKKTPSLKLAAISLDKGNLSDASDHADKAVAQQLENLTDLKIYQAELAYLRGSPKTAIKILQEAEQQAPNLQVYLLLEQFISNLDENGHEKALQWAKKGLEFSKTSSNSNDRHYKFYFQAKLGLLYRRLNNIDQSRKAFRTAIKAFNHAEKVPKHIRAVVAEEYGGYLLSHGENQDLSEALELHNKAIKLLKDDDLESTGQYVDYLSSRAYVYRSMGLLKKAESDYDLASKKYSKILYELGLSEEKVPNFLILFSSAAVVKALLGKHDDAIDTADFVIKSFANPELPQHIKFGRLRYSLGDVFSIFGNWKRATELYEQSKLILSKRENVEALALFRLYARLIVAKAYIASETPLDELEKKFEEYSQITLSKETDLALKHFALGTLDFFKKNFSSAKQNFASAAQYYDKVNYPPLEARALIWQANSILQEGEKTIACKIMQKALNKIKPLKKIHKAIIDEMPQNIKTACAPI